MVPFRPAMAGLLRVEGLLGCNKPLMRGRMAHGHDRAQEWGLARDWHGADEDPSRVSAGRHGYS